MQWQMLGRAFQFFFRVGGAKTRFEELGPFHRTTGTFSEKIWSLHFSIYIYISYIIRSKIECRFWISLLRREGQGSFMHVWLTWKFLLSLSSRFYRTKILRRVKKLLIFEGQPSDNFPIKICRANLVKIWSSRSVFFCILPL